MKNIVLVLLIALVGSCSKPTEEKQVSLSTHKYAVPAFADSTSFQRLQVAFPLVDSIFARHARNNHFPSIVYGVVAGGQLIHTGSTGYANIREKRLADSKTLFRIASMSKSFTAMAILKLRDEGRLSLTDPVTQYIPEFAKAGTLTTDAPPVTVQQLMTMAAGFPEDNPWGDRQLDDTDQELLDLVSNGVSFSNAPGTTFEYSNLGFALLGRIITQVADMPYQQYITEQIMKPIGMHDAKWEYEEVPVETLAHGYQWEAGTWREIPLMHDGAYGAMGGLICSIEDFAKYMSVHLEAWPPRNEAERAPVRRSSIREMHQPWRFNNLFADAKNRQGEICPVAIGYGYGLGWRKDCKGTVRVSHSGGLPGFGSEWRIYPDYGIGVVSFSNHTYGAPGSANAAVLDTLIALARLQPRVLPPSDLLNRRKEQIARLLPAWTEPVDSIFAENFFADEALERRRAAAENIFKEAGAIQDVKNLVPENQLRGTFTLVGEHKNIQVFFTLTPERAALIQQLDLTLVDR